MHPKHIVLAATVAALVSSLTAQTIDGSAPQGAATVSTQSAPQTEWQRFRAANPGTWYAQWNPATGTPEGIYGEGLNLGGRVETIEEARIHATKVLAQHATLLGTGMSEYVEIIGQKVIDKVHVLVYDQYFRGLKVIGGRADVRIHDVGVVSFFGTRAVPIPANFGIVPAIEAEAAIALGHKHENVDPMIAGGLVQPAAPKLVIWADTDLKTPTPVRLAWEVKIDRLDAKKVGRSYVDAQNGQVLGYASDYHECKWHEGEDHAAHDAECTHDHDHDSADAGMTWTATNDVSNATGATNVTGTIRGWTNLGLDNRDASFALTNAPLAGVRVTIPSTAAFAYTDASGNFNITHPGTTPVALQINFSNAQRQNGVTSSTGSATLNLTPTATPGTPLNVQIYTSTASSTDRAQTNAYWHVHAINEYCRSIIGALPAATDLITSTVNLASSCNAFYTGNTINFYAVGGGCVNTSYRTVVEHEWGHGLDDRYGGISNATGDGLSEAWGDIMALFFTGQPIIGPNFTTAGGIVRNAVNTTTHPCTGCGVHTAGQVFMGFAWDLRQRLIARLGAGPGALQAAKIVIGSLPADAKNQTNAVLQIFLLDDNDGNLANGTPYCTDIVAACNTKLLPLPVGLTCTANRYMYSPIANEAVEANSGNTFPFGGNASGQFSYMQVHGDMRGRAKTINALNFRQDTAVGGAARTINMALYMGGGSYTVFQTNFTGNYLTPRTLVANANFSMPAWTTPPVAPPGEFSFRLPLSAPFAWNGANDFLWEARVASNTVVTPNYADAVSLGASADLATDPGSSYGTGCFSTGQASRYSLGVTTTSSAIDGEHTVTFTGNFGVANAPAVILHGFAPASIPITGLCTQLLVGGTTINLNTTGNASGNFVVGPLPVAYNGSWSGIPTYTQAFCLDAARADAFKVSGTNGAKGTILAPIGVRIARLVNNGSSTATTGTLFTGSGFGYGLVLALD